MGNLAIYATKGFEYLLILGFLAAFVAFYLYFTSRRFEPVRAAVARGIGHMLEWFRVPDGVLFHQGHAWVQATSPQAGTVRVGLDDFAQKMVGQVEYVDLGKIGQPLRQGERAWTLKVGKKSVDMLSPVSGKIVDVNGAALAAPTLINSDPYGNGWLLEVQPDNLVRDRRNLLSGKMARKWMEHVTENLRNKMGEKYGTVMQDGGVPVYGMAKSIDPARWDTMVKEFFLTE